MHTSLNTVRKLSLSMQESEKNKADRIQFLFKHPPKRCFKHDYKYIYFIYLHKLYKKLISIEKRQEQCN